MYGIQQQQSKGLVQGRKEKSKRIKANEQINTVTTSTVCSHSSYVTSEHISCPPPPPSSPRALSWILTYLLLIEYECFVDMVVVVAVFIAIWVLVNLCACAKGHHCVRSFNFLCYILWETLQTRTHTLAHSHTALNAKTDTKILFVTIKVAAFYESARNSFRMRIGDTKDIQLQPDRTVTTTNFGRNRAFLGCDM